MEIFASLRPPRPEAEFRKHKGRLALFHPVENPKEYWKSYWASPYRAVLVENGQAGKLGVYDSLITTSVPRTLPVLDAGCGPGHLVMALRARGYDAIGIDYEPDIVRFVRETFPDLDVCVGDVLSIDFPSGYFGCYLSLGIVEHFEQGPDDALAEARRVLYPEGVAIIEVPYLNPARASYLRRLTETDGQPDMAFYQYYFSVEDFTARLRCAGFTVVDHLFHASESFLIREHPIFARLWNSRYCREAIKRVIRPRLQSPNARLQQKYGHTVVYVCRLAH